MGCTGWRWAKGLTGLALAGWFVMSLGCGNDESAGPDLQDETPGNWTRLLSGQASDPAYGPPGTPASGFLAFSSFRASATSDSVGQYEHIWILNLADSSLHQITRTDYNDLDPAWSPSGTRLCFTRDDGARRDIYWIDVSDPSSPELPMRLTDRAAVVSGATEGSWISVGGEEQIVFSDGRDILRMPVSGGSPVKVIPDPGDWRPTDCGGSVYEDLQPVPGPGSARMAFVSRGRSRVGTLRVRALGEGGVPVVGKMWLQGCDTLVTEGTEAFFSVLPAGSYTVRGVRDGLGLCDTLTIPVEVVGDQSLAQAETTLVDLSLVPTRGSLLVRTVTQDFSEEPYYLDCEVTNETSTPVTTRDGDLADSLIFTRLDCIPEGMHVIIAVQGELLDTAWVNVLAGEETPVTLMVLDSSYVDSALAGTSLEGMDPHGGEGNFFWRRCPGDSVCVDSVCVAFDEFGNCVDSACAVWDCEPGGFIRDWANVDTLCPTPPGGGRFFSGEGGNGPRFPLLRSRSLSGEAVWLFDTANSRLEAVPSGSITQRPVWDPTGGTRLAGLYRDGAYWSVRVLDLATGSTVDIPLPGQYGPFVCRRDALRLSWSPDGSKLVVALGPCSGGSYPLDLELWTVDLAPFGLR